MAPIDYSFVIKSKSNYFAKKLKLIYFNVMRVKSFARMVYWGEIRQKLFFSTQP